MSDKTQIEIIQVVDGPAERTSKQGRQYWIAKVKDGKTGRVGTAFGPWVKNWKFGDTIEGIWKKQPEYQGQEQWSIENPTATGGPRRSFGGGNASPLVSSFIIAATLMAPKFKGTKADLDNLTKLASAIKPLITEEAPAEEKKEEPAKPAKKAKKAEPEEEEEDVEEEEVEEEEDGDEEESLF